MFFVLCVLPCYIFYGNAHYGLLSVVSLVVPLPTNHIPKLATVPTIIKDAFYGAHVFCSSSVCNVH